MKVSTLWYSLGFLQRVPDDYLILYDLWSPAVFVQKLDYIHHNPLQDKWKLAEYPENYKYSSALFYETGIDEFELLTHYSG